MSVCGQPTSKVVFKKFLVQHPENVDCEDLHQKFFEQPEARNVEGVDGFVSQAHELEQTFLKSEHPELIFVRKKTEISANRPMHVPPRMVLYDFEHRYEVDDQMVKKKHIINGREYDALVQQSPDLDLQVIKKLRSSFIYEKNYYRLETLTNVEGCPTFLRAESHEETAADLKLPPFVPVVREVTGDDAFSTPSIARREFDLRD